MIQFTDLKCNLLDQEQRMKAHPESLTSNVQVFESGEKIHEYGEYIKTGWICHFIKIFILNQINIIGWKVILIIAEVTPTCNT